MKNKNNQPKIRLVVKMTGGSGILSGTSLPPKRVKTSHVAGSPGKDHPTPQGHVLVIKSITHVRGMQTCETRPGSLEFERHLADLRSLQAQAIRAGLTGLANSILALIIGHWRGK